MKMRKRRKVASAMSAACWSFKKSVVNMVKKVAAMSGIITESSQSFDRIFRLWGRL